MNKRLLLAFGCTALAFAACSPAREPAPGAEPEAQTASEPAEQTPGLQVDVAVAETAPEIKSVRYEGVLPAADGPGIKTTLEIFEDGRFALDETYIDRDVSFTEIGPYKKDGDILVLEMQDRSFRYYLPGKGQVQMLDMDKQPITGALAEYYVLKEVPEQK